jgi:hypothetical protein
MSRHVAIHAQVTSQGNRVVNQCPQCGFGGVSLLIACVYINVKQGSPPGEVVGYFPICIKRSIGSSQEWIVTLITTCSDLLFGSLEVRSSEHSSFQAALTLWVDMDYGLFFICMQHFFMFSTHVFEIITYRPSCANCRSAQAFCTLCVYGESVV